GAIGIGGNGAGLNGSLDTAKALIVTEDENLVLDDRATGGNAELVHTQLALGNALGIFEIIGSVQFFVAEEFPRSTMELIGAGLDGCVEHCAGGAAELSAEIRGLNLELLNCVHRRQDDEIRSVKKVDRVGVVVDAIKHVVVLRRAEPVGRECAAGGVAARIGL